MFNKKNSFLKSVGIDIIFVSVLLSYIYVIIKKLQGFSQQLQTLSFDTYDLEETLAQQANSFDINQLAGNLDLLNAVVFNMYLFLALLFVGSFLIYVIFQSFQWYFLTSSKKNYKTYLFQFLILSTLPFFLTLVLFFGSGLFLRNFFLQLLMQQTFVGYHLFILGFILILVSFIWYLLFRQYVFLSTFSLLQTYKKTFLFFSWKYFLLFLVYFLFSILFILAALSFGTFFLILILLATLLVFNWFRISFISSFRKKE